MFEDQRHVYFITKCLKVAFEIIGSLLIQDYRKIILTVNSADSRPIWQVVAPGSLFKNILHAQPMLKALFDTRNKIPKYIYRSQRNKNHKMHQSVVGENP